MNVKRIATSTQEQAVAAWIDSLNQLRLDTFFVRLYELDWNWEACFQELEKLKRFIGSPDHILGKPSTKHGEIAENMQVYISNARRCLDGLTANHSFEGVGRTAPEDYLRDGTQVQSKFLHGAAKTLLGNGNADGILQHFEKYPDFVKNGGCYDIPKDQYEEILRVIKLRGERPSALSKRDWTLLNAIDKLQNETGLDIKKDVCPTVVRYDEVQQGFAAKTVAAEEQSLKATDQKRRDAAYQASMPTWEEAGKAAGVSAAVEGGMAFCLGYVNKRKSGKKAADFTAEDWKEICIDTGAGTAKGAIRGGAVYAMTNFTATPACVASSLVTAAFGVIAQAKAHSEGKISDEDFLINSEAACLDVTVSAIASGLGQVLIPVPVLGAIVGNVAGTFAYELAKETGLAEEQQLIGRNQTDIQLLDAKLAKQYAELMRILKAHFDAFEDLIAYAFDPDVNASFIASVEFARFNGVPEDRILKSKEDIDSFFMS